MRKNLIFFVSLLSILTLFSACEDSDMAGLTPSLTIPQVSPTYNLSVNKTQLSVPQGASTASFTITSNGSWTVSCDQEWISSILPKQGSGNSEVSVSVAANTTKEERTATIVVTGNQGKTVEVLIRQDASAEPVPELVDGKEFASLIKNMSTGEHQNFDTSNNTIKKIVFEVNSSVVNGTIVSSPSSPSKVYANYTSATQTLTICTSAYKIGTPKDFSCAFFGLRKLSHIVGIESLDTRNTEDMSEMFRVCDSLQTLDVSHFDTRNVTNMHMMFQSCPSLQTLHVSNFDTRNVTNMGEMFRGCNNLQSLDVSNFDTRNVTDMGWMFCGCDNLQSLDVSNFDTRNVTRMSAMFGSCDNLQSLDVSNFDTRKVTDMWYMFAYCSALQTLNLSNFDTHNVTNMNQMFASCSALQTLNLSNFDTRNVTDMGDMFSRCNSIKTMSLGLNFKIYDHNGLYFDSGMFYNFASKSKSCTITCYNNTYKSIYDYYNSNNGVSDWSYLHWNILDMEIETFGSDKEI